MVHPSLEYKYGQQSKYANPDIMEVLEAEPDQAALVASNGAFPAAADPDDIVYGEGFEDLDEDGGNEKWDAILASVPTEAHAFERPLVRRYDKFEKSDSKHRMADLLRICYRVYKKKFPMPKADRSIPDFFKWLDALPELERVFMLKDSSDSNLKPSVVKAFVKGVAYLDAATRKSYRVKLAGSQASWRKQPFHTENMKTVFSGQGFAIWVISPIGKMYAGNHVYGQFHHSSFMAGGNVTCGGECKAVNGKIEFLSAKSGHYQPPLANLFRAIELLKVQGVDVANLHVAVWKEFDLRRPVLMTGDNFGKKAKGYQAWGDFTQEQKNHLRAGRYNMFPSV